MPRRSAAKAGRHRIFSWVLFRKEFIPPSAPAAKPLGAAG
jgi:hypothetical protein